MRPGCGNFPHFWRILTDAGTLSGTIIGGQNQAAPIKSETIRRDNRKTVLVYNKGTLEFAPEDYSVLMKLIPDKELSVAQQRRALNTTAGGHSQQMPSNTLRELKRMLDEGLITEKEFNTKKVEILNRM